MNPHRVILCCEPFPPRTGLGGVYHGPMAAQKITVERPVEGHLDQEIHCPACDAALVVRTYPWAPLEIVRRRRRLLIYVVLALTAGWIAAAVLAVPALRMPLAVAPAPILLLLLILAGRVAMVTGAELTDGVEYVGTHAKHDVY